MSNFEIINLTSGKKVTVKKLIKIILKINKKPNYRLLVKNDTPGDSFGTHSSIFYLKKKFRYLKFMELEKSLKKYFHWINTLPIRSNLKKYHPLNRKNKL